MGRPRPSMVAGGIVFLVVFAGLTIVALASAELNVATVVVATVSLFICVVVAIALISAIRGPPEE